MRARSILSVPLLSIAVLALTACRHAETSASRAQPARIDAAARFEALWWSEAQMEGMDPNHPPPKTTRVVLEKWEYTDPVGVPHPDSVDLVVELRNCGEQAAEGVTVEGTGAWLQGSIRDRQSAKWTTGWPLPARGPLRLAPGERTAVRIPIDLASEMKLLFPKQWPWALRTEVHVRGASGQPVTPGPLVKELPITPGD